MDDLTKPPTHFCSYHFKQKWMCENYPKEKVQKAFFIRCKRAHKKRQEPLKGKTALASMAASPGLLTEKISQMNSKIKTMANKMSSTLNCKLIGKK